MKSILSKERRHDSLRPGSGIKRNRAIAWIALSIFLIMVSIGLTVHFLGLGPAATAF